MDQSIPQPGFSGEPPRTELQRRVDGGEEPRAILDELYREWQAPLFVRACRSLGDARDAKDVVQEVFLKMYTNFDRMIAREPVRAWILTVANHELVDWNRRKKKSGGGELLADFDALELNLARRSQAERFEEQVETRVGSVEPLLAYLRTLVAKGSLGDNHLRVCWHHIAGRGTQQELARELGLTQSRISQLKSEVAPRVCAALYFCEILGIVRAPRREAEIRQERYRNDHPSPAEQMKRLEEIYEVEAEVEAEMKHITTDPGIVAALNKNEDDTESKPHRRRKRTVTRKHKADE